MSGISDALTAEQEQALQLYLGGASISEVADAVKVPPEEVREWMRGEGFRFALAEALLDERELERQRLGRLKELALDTIEEGLRSEDDSQRMAAAKAVLDWPGRAVLGARGTKAGVWIASVAAVLIVASWAMIGLLANEILTSRHETHMPAPRHAAHAAEAPRASDPARGANTTTAISAARAIADQEAGSSDTLATVPTVPGAVPEPPESSKQLRPLRPAASRPSTSRRSARTRNPQEVADFAPVASGAVASAGRAGLHSKGPGRLGIAMSEHEF